MQRKLFAVALAMTSAIFAANCLAAKYHKPTSHYKNFYSYKDTVCPHPLILQKGFYLGAHLLNDSYRIRAANATLLPAAISASSSQVIGAGGWGGGIMGGYGTYFYRRLYLGSEIFVNATSVNQSGSVWIAEPITGTIQSSTTSAGISWGISILPGYKLNDATLGYLRLGYEQNEIRGKYAVVTSTGVSGFTKANNMNWRNGFEYGIGLETAVYPNLSLRTEINHTRYSNFANALGNYKPSNNQFGVGLLYHFT